MAFQRIDEFNITGIDGLFLYDATIVPAFIPLILFAVFVVTLLGTFFSQKRLTGDSDMISSFAVASWFTLIIGFVLNLITDLVNITVLSVMIALAIISAIMLLTAGDKRP